MQATYTMSERGVGREVTVESVVGWEFILSQLTREPWQRLSFPSGVWGGATPVNDFWSTQFRVILCVLVHSGSWLLAIITPKYKKIESIAGVGKVTLHASIFIVDQTQSSECSEQENFRENDRQTIK